MWKAAAVPQAQVIDCCAVLKVAADHASTSDFIRQVSDTGNLQELLSHYALLG